MIRFFSRKLLDIWGFIGIAPGWRYQTFEKFGQDLASSSPLSSFLPNHCHISCYLADHVQRQIYFMGVYEPVESYLFTHLLKPGMTVIDAGANIGQYTLLASTIVGTEGAVHSFEPVPDTFVQISTNVKVNQLSNVYLNQAALWNESTTLKLSLSDEMKDNIGSYSVGVKNQATTVESVSVRLDDYIVSKKIKRVDLIKMDIEGAEFSALTGMQEVLERERPILLIELNRLALQRVGYTPESIWNLLVNKFDYLGYLIEIDSCKKISDTSEIQQKNILFVHKSKIPDFIKDGWDLKYILRWARSGKKLFSA